MWLGWAWCQLVIILISKLPKPQWVAWAPGLATGPGLHDLSPGPLNVGRVDLWVGLTEGDTLLLLDLGSLCLHLADCPQLSLLLSLSLFFLALGLVCLCCLALRGRG